MPLLKTCLFILLNCRLVRTGALLFAFASEWKYYYILCKFLFDQTHTHTHNLNHTEAHFIHYKFLLNLFLYVKVFRMGRSHMLVLKYTVCWCLLNRCVTMGENRIKGKWKKKRRRRKKKTELKIFRYYLTTSGLYRNIFKLFKNSAQQKNDIFSSAKKELNSLPLSMCTRLF